MSRPKYRLDHQLGLLRRDITIDAIIQILAREYGISRDTFYRDRSLTIDDEFSIPSSRLEIYAGLFGVTSDDLKNYPPKKVKPLSERNISKLAKSIIKKAKLTRGK
jgi:hypothetical protein